MCTCTHTTHTLSLLHAHNTHSLTINHTIHIQHTLSHTQNAHTLTHTTDTHTLSHTHITRTRSHTHNHTTHNDHHTHTDLNGKEETADGEIPLRDGEFYIECSNSNHSRNVWEGIISPSPTQSSPMSWRGDCPSTRLHSTAAHSILGWPYQPWTSLLSPLKCSSLQSKSTHRALRGSVGFNSDTPPRGSDTAHSNFEWTKTVMTEAPLSALKRLLTGNRRIVALPWATTQKKGWGSKLLFFPQEVFCAWGTLHFLVVDCDACSYSALSCH